MAVDIGKVLRDALVRNAGVVALTSERVVWGIDYPEEYTPQAGPLLLYNVRGGATLYHSATADPSVQYQAVAATPTEAMDLALAVIDALHEEPLEGIRQSLVESQPQMLEGPDNGWHIAFFAFRHWLVN